MKIHIKFFVLLIMCNTTYAQDIKSPYFNQLILNSTNDLEIPTNSSDGTVMWHRLTNLSGYTGEYEIVLNNNWLTWAWYENYVPLAQSITLFFDMEILSFPFTPDCYQNPNGCAGQAARNFVMPDNSTPYLNNSWGPISRKEPISRYGQQHQSLASLFYKDNFPIPLPNTTVQPRFVLPHTVIKHTIYVHCEDNTPTNLTPSTPWAAKISWIYDNTRGRMKFYPFCPCNCSTCSMNQYDVAFYPHLLHKTNHQYDETSSTAVSQNGVVDHYPFVEINQNILCTKPLIIPPAISDPFDNPGGFGYNKVYPPPYSLISAPLYQFRGRAPAGYNFSNYNQLPGMMHTYNIQNSIDIVATEISKEDRIIYNPSEVNISTSDLVFPSHFSFRTIRGQYPTPAEVATDNISIYGYGNPNSDPRQVPVRTDLRCENPNYPSTDSRYASLYRLLPNSHLTIAPCVSIFDAAFILNSGSTLKYENYNTQIGYYPDNLTISRVAIDRNGGRLIRQYDNTLPNATLYLQHQTEVSTAPNSYIVDEKIMAGSNVDPGQTAGPYIASSGTALELIAKNYVKLENGFQAHAGSEVKIAVDPTMNIPICPPIPPAPSNNSRIFNSQSQEFNSTASKAILTPNPVQQYATVSLLQSGNSNYIQRIQLHDAKGQLLFTKENINNASEQLDAQNLTDGLYFLTVTTNNKTETLKFIVSKNY